MDIKTSVKYVTYAASIIAIITLVHTAPVQVGVLVVSGLVNVFYVRR